MIDGEQADGCGRRDGCPLIRNSVSAIAKHLANTADVEGASLLVKEVVRRVMQVALCSFPTCPKP